MIKKLSILLLLIFLSSAVSLAADTKGIGVVAVKDAGGKSVAAYSGSYALVVGVSDYTAGWPDLESIPGELEKVEAALQGSGFNVTKVLNPAHEQLYDAFRKFINAYGYDRNNRLLFFYSGHGYSRKDGKKGYLAPADAPDPRKDEKGFLRKALTMSQILTWCRNMEAKHALFLFDSCFSGTVFKTRGLPDQPPHISAITSKPVRQFIAAGSSDQEVPARSVFAPSFVRALRGEADLTGDGYITGTELGLFLRDKVLYYQTGQTPQYGKIRDPDLDEGDFVFVVNTAPVRPVIPRPAPQPTAPAASPPPEITRPAAGDFGGKNKLYVMGQWRLYYPEGDNDVYLWTKNGDYAAEIIGDSNGWWKWRQQKTEHTVWPYNGSLEKDNFYERPWENIGGKSEYAVPRGASFRVNGSEGVTNYEYSGDSIIITLTDGGRVTLDAHSTTARFINEDGESFSYAQGARASGGASHGQYAAFGEKDTLFAIGDWRLYYPSGDNDIYIWHIDERQAVEIVGDSNGWWQWKNGGSEYTVWSADGSTDKDKFYARPWEKYRNSSGNRVSDGASFTVAGDNGSTRFRLNGNTLTVKLADSGQLSIPLANTRISYVNSGGQRYNYPK